MYWSEPCAISWWWLFPIIMMAICFFMMRGRWGAGMCGSGSRNFYGRPPENRTEAKDILDRRFAAGEIDQQEYEEKKSVLAESMDSHIK